MLRVFGDVNAIKPRTQSMCSAGAQKGRKNLARVPLGDHDSSIHRIPNSNEKYLMARRLTATYTLIDDGKTSVARLNDVCLSV